jgi:hypothetical protein
MKSFFRLLLVLTIALVTTGSRADADDDALVEKGLKLRRDGRDAEALALFRRAYEARPAPRTQAQIALAEQALGKWVEAERDLLLALALADDPWITSHRQTLDKALATIGKRLGTLTVEANAPEAELLLNGAQAGKLPVRQLRVAAGTVLIEVRAKHYAPLARSIEISPGATSTERFELSAIREPAKPAVEIAATARPAAPETPTPAPNPTDIRVKGAVATRRAFAWGALGAAGAFLGGAIAAQIVREGNAARYNDDGRCLYGNLSRDERCGVYRGHAESAQGLANIGYVAAGAFGVASAILFWSSVSTPKTSGLHIGLAVGSSGAELTVRGKL